MPYRHLIFLFYIVALCSGAVAITVSLLFHLQHRKKVIKYYTLLLLSITLILIAKMIGVYAAVCALSPNPTALLIATIFQKSGYALALFTGPFFAHDLIGVVYSRLKKGVFTTLTSLFALATAGELIAPYPFNHQIEDFISLPILFGSFVYLIGLGLFHLRKLGSKELTISLKITLALAITTFPFALIQYLTHKPYLPGYMEIPLSFALVNVAGIIFAFFNFNKPAYYENDSLSGFFREKFQITEREQQIISLVLKGCTNTEMSEKLFISSRTVESHLYRIFQKMAISNRMQLVNLIMSNRKE